jgi:hypothetical protein
LTCVGSEGAVASINALVERALTRGVIRPMSRRLRNSYFLELRFSALRIAALAVCRYFDTLNRSRANYATRAA